MNILKKYNLLVPEVDFVPPIPYSSAKNKRKIHARFFVVQMFVCTYKKQVVFLPVALGLLLNTRAKGVTRRLAPYTPLL